MVDDEWRTATQPRGQCLGKRLGGGTCVWSVKEQNYVFASCNFVPVDGVEYFPGIGWRERYKVCFCVFVCPENKPVDNTLGLASLGTDF